jgi:hypothetical protein
MSQLLMTTKTFADHSAGDWVRRDFSLVFGIPAPGRKASTKR